jgi:hypothetical protein
MAINKAEAKELVRIIEYIEDGEPELAVMNLREMIHNSGNHA